MTVSTFPALQFFLPKGDRYLAYSSVGDVNSPHVLLCLPGLLETRATFDPLLQDAKGVQGLRVVSLDLCGRGDSSPLPGDKGYSMQVYLEDVEHFIRHALMPEGKPVPYIDVLGTSMGGILAMYLASDADNHIRGLFFNDIGLDLPWMSIYGLYGGMKKAGRVPAPEEIAAQLNVRVGAVLAVQSPTHFNLPYRKDWKGMKFGHLLSNFKGPLRLIHGSNSGVCTAQQVKDLQREFPQAHVLEVAGAGHPVPFNAEVNQFVLSSLDLPVAAPAKVESPQAYTQMSMVLDDAPVWKEPTAVSDEPVEVMKSVEVSEPTPPPVGVTTPPEGGAPPQLSQVPGLWAWLKRQLGATKK